MNKKRLTIILSLVAALVACVMLFTACGEDNENNDNDKDAVFAAPQNPKVTETTFSWDGVTGADNGYTVKINNGTVTVNGTQIDLTSTEAAAHIKEGANKLSVKVNATDTVKESKYSSEVTYTYTIEEDGLSAAAKAFNTAVGAIATVDEDSDKDAIDGADAAITAALADYEALSEDDKTAVADAKTLLDGKQTALNEVITAQKEAYVAAINDVIDAAEAEPVSITDLENAITAANAKKAALAQATVAAMENYETLNSSLENAQTKLDGLKAAAASVKEIKDRIDAIDGTATVTVEYYNELTAIKESIDALVGYAATLWDENDTETLDAEIDRVLTVAVSSHTDVEVFVNGGAGTITVLYAAVNVLDQTVTGATPELNISVDADATVNTENAAFTETDGLYIYRVNFTKKGGDAATEAGYQLKVEYSIGGGQTQTLVYKAIEDDAYINTTDKVLIKEDKIQYAGAPGDPAYLDIYKVDDISIGEENDADPVISDFPLIKKVPVTNGMKVEDLRRQLARAYGDLLIGNEYEVRFVMYKMTVDEEGITISNIKNSLVSHDTYTLDLAAEEAKFPIDVKGVYDLGVWGGSGNISLISNAQVPNFISQFKELYPDLLEADNDGNGNVDQYFQILISAYEYVETTDEETGETTGEKTDNLLFSKVVPFKNQGYNYFTYMKDWAVAYFKNGGEDNGQVKFRLTLTIQPTATVDGQPNPLAKDYKDSASSDVTVQNDYTGTYTFTKADLTLPTDIQIGRTNEAIFLQGFTIANEIMSGYVSHVEIYFKKGLDTETYSTAYILWNGVEGDGAQFSLHKKADGSDSGIDISKGGNEYWRSFNDVNTWFKNNYDSDFDMDGEGWYFQTKIVDNENDDYYLFGDGESEWKTFYVAPATPSED